jgi:ubiquinone/menaquinone biosynthesis C-methylase UbiE
MLSIPDRIAQHYARADLEQTILAALVASGKDPDLLAPSDLSPVDEFHAGGREATTELAGQVGFAPGMHILDVGCGIGGPSRVFAAERGCRVTGIDLTADYVRTAEALARRVGLADRVSYRQASAVALPFADATFDGVYTMHVCMNIADKPAVFAEVHRVLKPGGRFAVYDIMRTGPGDLGFPLHWAATADTSFVASPEEYRDALEAVGFDILKQRDRGDFVRAFFRQIAARTAQDGMPPLGIHLLMKSDVPQKVANFVSALEAGVVAPVEVIAQAR